MPRYLAVGYLDGQMDTFTPMIDAPSADDAELMFFAQAAEENDCTGAMLVGLFEQEPNATVPQNLIAEASAGPTFERCGKCQKIVDVDELYGEPDDDGYRRCEECHEPD